MQQVAEVPDGMFENGLASPEAVEALRKEGCYFKVAAPVRDPTVR